MTELIYQPVEPITKAEADVSLDSGDPPKIISALLGAAYHINDWRWVQDRCLSFLDNSVADVRNVAVLSLSHIARIHGDLDKEKVLSMLEKFQYDPEMSEEISQTIEEIEWYLAHPET